MTEFPDRPQEFCRVGPPLEETPGVHVRRIDGGALGVFLAHAHREAREQAGGRAVVLLDDPEIVGGFIVARSVDLPKLASLYVAAHWGVMKRRVAKARGLKDDPELGMMIAEFRRARPEAREAAMRAVGIDPGEFNRGED